MRSVAFFRNLNLGQGWSPTRAQLVEAFEHAGAHDVLSFQVNGTVLFTSRAPVQTVRGVLADLLHRTGYDDLGVVRPATWCVALADRLEDLPFDVDESTEVALFDARRPLPVELPWATPDGTLRILAGDHRHAVTGWRRQAGRGANATPVLQGLVGVPVTSRGTPTMTRLAQKIRARP